ncbi:hypothetical protein VFPBJ_08317 [Purpureocillium lilacinum]|uniref:Uncharacterized protein n=1 Tax=Purpureocillium lilacinum TaxID=33203 RepID=A0A179GJ10_PURLI|nr:hypothetical protein VFPBJ_08317 [Purpureocillium lilacinum]
MRREPVVEYSRAGQTSDDEIMTKQSRASIGAFRRRVVSSECGGPLWNLPAPASSCVRHLERARRECTLDATPKSSSSETSNFEGDSCVDWTVAHFIAHGCEQASRAERIDASSGTLRGRHQMGPALRA